jgi:hypothetical protein
VRYHELIEHLQHSCAPLDRAIEVVGSNPATPTATPTERMQVSGVFTKIVGQPMIIM